MSHTNGAMGRTNGPLPLTLTDNQFRQLLDVVNTETTLSRDVFRRMLDPRRSIEDECGYPRTDQLSPEAYRDQFDRNPIANRVVSVLPRECWQHTPSVYEDEEAEVTTPFEVAWDELGQGLRGEASWYCDEEGHPVWEVMKRADILSRVGHFGVLLLGLDDGGDLMDPVEGAISYQPRKAVKEQDPALGESEVGGGETLEDDPEQEEPAGNVLSSNLPLGAYEYLTPPSPQKRGAKRKGVRVRLVANGPRRPLMPDSPMSRDEEDRLLANRGLKTPLNEQELAAVRRWSHERSHPPPPRPTTNLRPTTKATTSDGSTAEESWERAGKSMDSGIQGQDRQYYGAHVGLSEWVNPEASCECRRLLFVRAFSEDLVQVVRYENNINNPRFGLPVVYRITLTDPRQTTQGIGLPTATVFVHWTRVIHLADNLTSSEVAGVPACRPILNRLLDVEKVQAASAEGYWKSGVPGLGIETQSPDVDINVEAAKTAIENFQNSQQKYLLLQGLKATTIAPSVVDPTPFITTAIQAICIQIGVPQRVFMGSERGELASSQDDAAWNDRLRERQQTYITPRMIVPFVDRLILLGVLPEPECGYAVYWPDLDSLGEKDKADVGKVRTETMGTYIEKGVEAMMSPGDFYTKVLGFSDEEATAIIDAACMGQQTTMTIPPEGMTGHPASEPPPPPLLPDGTPNPAAAAGIDPLTGEPTPPPMGPGEQVAAPVSGPGDLEDDPTQNAFCPTGEGGGVDPTCSPKWSPQWEGHQPEDDEEGMGDVKYINLKDIYFPGGFGKEVAKLQDNGKMPIIVERTSKGYLLIDGWGRTSGMLNAGKEKIRAIIVTKGDIAERTTAGDDEEWNASMYEKYTNLEYQATTNHTPTRNATGPGEPDTGPLGNYDPSQPRDPGGEGGGQWTKSGAGGGGADQHPGDKAKGIKTADVDVSRDPDSPPGTRYRRVTRETTHEGVQAKDAKSLTPEQNAEVVRWHDGMTQVNKNGKNSRLPDEAHSADYNDYERGALQKYSYKNDGPLNGKLRGKEDWDALKDANGKPTGEKVPYNDDFYDQMDKNLQSAFDKTPVMENPVTVVRGMNLEGKNLEGFIGKMEASMASGQPMEMGGYTSTAAPGGLLYKMGLDSGIPRPFRGNISLKINAVHGIDMGPHSQLPGEAELLLDKRSRFVVKSIKKGKNGEYQIEVDQLPPPRPTGNMGVDQPRDARGRWTDSGDAGPNDDVEIHDKETGEVFWRGPRKEAEDMVAADEKESGPNPTLGLRRATKSREQAEAEEKIARERADAERAARRIELDRIARLATPIGLRPGHPDYVSPPETMYHATFSGKQIREQGFKSGDEVGQHTLGGTASHTVSFTTKQNAEIYRDGLSTARSAAKGEMTDDQMVSAAVKFGVSEDQAKKLLRDIGPKGHGFEFFQLVSMKGKQFPLFMGGSWPSFLATAPEPEVLAVRSADVMDVYYNPGEKEWRIADYKKLKAV